MLREGYQFSPEVLAIFDSALEGIMIADAGCVIRYINPAYTRMTGLTGETEVGRILSDGTVFGPLREAIQKRCPVYGRRYKPKGSSVELVINASPILVGDEVIGGVSFSQDISDVLLLTKKLSQSKEMVQVLSERLDGLASASFTFEDIVGSSEEMVEATQLARRAARTNSTILLSGESGTGKEIFAQAIHNYSPRREKPFIKVNCAAIPEALMESEFFGHEKGAFTGADRRKLGLFELADQGSIFLDEVGDMSLLIQAKVLRVLQDGELTRVGGEKPLHVDVRVIAATNRNLPELIAAGRFREDLYFRLNVVGIQIPPLRLRMEDLPALVDHTIRKHNRKLGRQVVGIEARGLEKLRSYHWPGNVRELENVLERAMSLTESEVLTASSLLLPRGQWQQEEELSLEKQEMILIRKALTRYGTSVEGKKKAAAALGISLATLYKRLAGAGGSQ